MTEARYMLMVRTQAPSSGVTVWAALLVPGEGRAFTRERVEEIASYEPPTPRFLFPYNEQTADFGPDEGDAPTLGLSPGETIWNHGEPTRIDSLGMLRAAAAAPTRGGSVEAPFADKFPVRVGAVSEVAMEWFDAGDSHALEAHFDRLVMDIGGVRHGDPPWYHLPLTLLGAS